MLCVKHIGTVVSQALITLILLAPQLPAQVTSPSLDGLLAAIAERVDDLEFMTFPSKAQTRERKQLTKAHAELEAYVGDNEKADLLALRKVVRAVVRSRSEAAAILGALDAVLETLDGVAGAARADALGQRLAETLRTSSDPVATAMLLRSLGNSGAPALLDSAIPFLFDPEPLVRSAAAHAVGRLPRQGNAELLCLSQEPQGLVRASIAQGLVRLGEPDTRALRIVDQRVTAEPHDVARLAMARYLADHLDTYPASRTTLTSMRDRDPSRRIRLLLLEALGI